MILLYCTLFFYKILIGLTNMSYVVHISQRSTIKETNNYFFIKNILIGKKYIYQSINFEYEDARNI